MKNDWLKCTIIAECLRKILPDLIILTRFNSFRFLPKRNLQKNVRTTLNILEYYEKHSDKPVSLIFLDAEKASDDISWTCLRTELEYMEFGHRTLHVIEQIYSSQDTKIIVNGKLTKSIEIQKGTRQSCPLSPLLFILLLET